MRGPPAYYRALDAVQQAGQDLTGCFGYCAEGLRQTLERTWTRVQSYDVKSKEKLVPRPRQEQLLKLLRDHGSLSQDLNQIIEIKTRENPSIDSQHRLSACANLSAIGDMNPASGFNGRFGAR